MIKDVKMVRDQSKTQPQNCKGELTPESISERVSDRVQDRFTHYPDRATGKEYEANRPSGNQAGKLTPVTSEGAHECLSYYHESGVLFAEDVGQHMAFLPEVDMCWAR